MTARCRSLEAIAWKYRAGSPWRDLPGELGPFQTAHQRLLRWAMNPMNPLPGNGSGTRSWCWPTAPTDRVGGPHRLLRRNPTTCARTLPQQPSAYRKKGTRRTKKPRPDPVLADRACSSRAI
ncbi:transposase [Streptomyces goshikiensis]